MSGKDFKVVFMGAAGVGKTSLIHRYCMGKFSDNTLATVGVSFFSKRVQLEKSEITLMIWDTAGEERFRSVAPSLLRGTDGLVIVYDLTRPSTLTEIDFYFRMFLDMVKVQHDKPPVLLLGNKHDLVDEERVDNYEVVNWLNKRNVTMTAEVSAKTGDGVEDAMFKLAECVALNYADDDTQRTGLLRENTARRKCC